MGEIWAIVLAAGTSSRLGRPKQLLPLGGEPLLNHVLRATAMARVDGTILVLGHLADQIAGQIGDFGQATIVNRDYAAGQSTSLRAGIAALSPETDGALILLGDQPVVTPTLIDQVIDRWREAGGRSAIVQARYGKVGAPPVLIGRDLFPELGRIEGDLGARELVRAQRDTVVAVETADDEPFDVDTVEDYQRLVEQWASRRR